MLVFWCNWIYPWYFPIINKILDFIIQLYGPTSVVYLIPIIFTILIFFVSFSCNTFCKGSAKGLKVCLGFGGKGAWSLIWHCYLIDYIIVSFWWWSKTNKGQDMVRHIFLEKCFFSSSKKYVAIIAGQHRTTEMIINTSY